MTESTTGNYIYCCLRVVSHRHKLFAQAAFANVRVVILAHVFTLIVA